MVRQWGEDRYIPIRQEVDEDWRDHKLITPLMKEVLVDLGVNAAFFPVETGGTDMPEPVTISAIVCEELARIDSGFATACICSIWGMVPILLEPHRNMDLLEEFGPKFCGEDLYVGCMAMTEPQSGADIENTGRMRGTTIQTTSTLMPLGRRMIRLKISRLSSSKPRLTRPIRTASGRRIRSTTDSPW